LKGRTRRIGARVIVTFNGRHFPPDALEPWLIEAQHPDDFLVNLYRQHSEILVGVLREQARAIRWELSEVLVAQRKGMPRFVQLVAEELSLEL
jgi:hypothetical protein